MVTVRLTFFYFPRHNRASTLMVHILLHDGITLVEIGSDVANLWGTVADCIEDCGNDDAPVPLPTESAVPMAIKCLEQLAQTSAKDREEHASELLRYPSMPIPDEQTQLFSDMPIADLITVLKLANFLNYPHGVAAVARFMGRQFAQASFQELKAMFNLEGPLTAEAKEMLTSYNPWLA